MPDVVNIDISMVQRTIESFILWYTLMAVHKPLILELKLWLTDINSSIHSLCVLMSVALNMPKYNLFVGLYARRSQY